MTTNEQKPAPSNGHKTATLTLIGNESDEKQRETHRQCRAMLDAYHCFHNSAEMALEAGMLVPWKPGMKNRGKPDYGEPRVVMEILNPPVIDTTFDATSVYFRERLDLVLGYIDDEGDLCMYHYDSRRFEPWQGDDRAPA